MNRGNKPATGQSFAPGSSGSVHFKLPRVTLELVVKLDWCKTSTFSMSTFSYPLNQINDIDVCER